MVFEQATLFLIKEPTLALGVLRGPAYSRRQLAHDPGPNLAPEGPMVFKESRLLLI